MTGREIDPNVIKDVIDNMPEWKPGLQKGEPIPFVHNLMLNVANGKIVIPR